MPGSPRHLGDKRYPPRRTVGTARLRRRRLAGVVLSALALGGLALLLEQRRGSSTIGTGEVAGRNGAMNAPATAPTTTTTAPTTTTFPPPMTIQPLAAEPGIAPVITRVETTDPVVFLTIDDGLTRLPEGLEEFKRLGMPASLFLVNEPVERDPEYFRSMPGTLIESHTQSHMNLRGQPEEVQREEICGNADRIESIYGRRPVLFRPPFGNYDAATKRAAAACGMRAVVIWQENVNWDVVGFREVQHFRPGDIILMHFRPQFIEELNVIKQRVEEAGLRFALLEDYIAADTVPVGFERPTPAPPTISAGAG